MPRGKVRKAKCFYYVDDIQKMLGIGEVMAYKLIRRLNGELKKKGYLTFRGRVAKKYFDKRFCIQGGL